MSGRIVWGVAVNLVQLFVIFAVLQAGREPFESIVLATIVLTYMSIQYSSGGFARALTETNLRSSRQFHALAKLLNDPAVQQHSTSLEEAEAEFTQREARWWIDMGSSAIGWVMALWFMFLALRG